MSNKNILKKGQLTVFMILGILILLLFSAVLFFSREQSEGLSQKEAQKSVDITLENKAVKELIEKCIRIKSDEAILKSTSQGLYIQQQTGYKYNNFTAYWINQTINIIPTDLTRVENEIKEYIDNNLPLCIDINHLKENGWEINRLETNSTVNIFNETVLISTMIDSDLKKQDQRLELVTYQYNTQIRLRRMYEKSIDLLNNKFLDIYFDINDPLANYDPGEFIIDTQRLDNKTLIISLGDRKSKAINGQQVKLKFIVNFETNPNAISVYEFESRLGNLESTYIYSPDRKMRLYIPRRTKSTSQQITISQSYPQNITATVVSDKFFSSTSSGNSSSMSTTNHTIITDYPIYELRPSGTNFSKTLILQIKNEDLPKNETFLLWNNNRLGWVSYPTSEDNTQELTTSLITSFSSGGVQRCENQSNASFNVTAKYDKSIWQGIIEYFIYAADISYWIEGLWDGTDDDSNALFSPVRYIITDYQIGWLGYYGQDEKTISFTPLCSSEVILNISKSDVGDGGCIIREYNSTSRYETSGGTHFRVRGGQKYELIAVLDQVDELEEDGKITCSITGVLLTPLNVTNNETNVTANETLVCCKTEDGYCVDNYGETTCREYGGTPYYEVCAEVNECTPAPRATTLTGGGNLLVEPSTGKKGDSFQIIYFVSDKIAGDVRATVNVNGNKNEVTLYDDGAHGDGRAGNYYYGGVWNSNAVELTSSSVKATIDIAITAGNASAKRENVGTILLNARSTDCQTLSTWNTNAAHNIVFVENNYGQTGGYQSDVSANMNKFNSLTPIQSYTSTSGLNYFRIDKDFETSNVQDIKYYAATACSVDNSKTTYIILDKLASGCASYGNYYVLNPSFSFNTLANQAESAETLFAMLCPFIQA